MITWGRARQTPWLDGIGTDSAEPICAGTLHELDAQVRIVEELLDFQVDDKLELYLLEDDPSEWCPDGVPGCYSRQGKHAFATIEVAGHEIVHAAVHGNVGSGDAFFSEGLAVELTGKGLSFPRTSPASNLGLSSSEVAQPDAGHFMRWLRSEPHGLVGDWFDGSEGTPIFFSTEIDLETGFYDIEIIEPGTSPTTAGVSLYPKIGTLPTVP